MYILKDIISIRLHEIMQMNGDANKSNNMQLLLAIFANNEVNRVNT